MSNQVPNIRFVGVWDTVSSVGWIDNPLHVPYEANNPSIEIARHAVSIDEHRVFFRSHLWQRQVDPAKPHDPVNIQQVWFRGVHCDVGGGYPEAESALSKYPLEWMIEQAKATGLLVVKQWRIRFLEDLEADRTVRRIPMDACTILLRVPGTSQNSFLNGTGIAVRKPGPTV
jgi:uncharacterized protein (DUF2235 family)